MQKKERYMFRLARQAGTNSFAISLGLIVFIVLGFIRENIGQASTERTEKMEVETMKTKKRQNVKLGIWSLCNSV